MKNPKTNVSTFSSHSLIDSSIVFSSKNPKIIRIEPRNWCNELCMNSLTGWCRGRRPVLLMKNVQTSQKCWSLDSLTLIDTFIPMKQTAVQSLSPSLSLSISFSPSLPLVLNSILFIFFQFTFIFWENSRLIQGILQTLFGRTNSMHAVKILDGNFVISLWNDKRKTMEFIS